MSLNPAFRSTYFASFIAAGIAHHQWALFRSDSTSISLSYCALICEANMAVTVWAFCIECFKVFWLVESVQVIGSLGPWAFRTEYCMIFWLVESVQVIGCPGPFIRDIWCIWVDIFWNKLLASFPLPMSDSRGVNSHFGCTKKKKKKIFWIL